jgi:uncharacterized protein YjeT (DUF2065 family)
VTRPTFVLPFVLAFVLPFALPFADAFRRMASIAAQVPDRGLRRPPTSQPQPN